jgi:hypothetical protein
MTRPWGNRPMNPWAAAMARRASRGNLGWGCDVFAAQIGATKSGRLRFTNGAHEAVICADPDVWGLYRAHFSDRMPTVSVDGGDVTVSYPRRRGCYWPDYWAGHHAEVTLNTRIPWSVEIHGGAIRIAADLRKLRLRALDIDGGTGRLEVLLPTPDGPVVVAIAGGASNVAILRPEGVATRLRVGGGVTHLRLDERHIGAAGGELDLRAGDYDHAIDRYEVSIMGGANNVSVCAPDKPGVEPCGRWLGM